MESSSSTENKPQESNNSTISKPASPGALDLKVKGQDGNEVFFRVKKTTLLSKLMSAYCKKIGADVETVRFLFDGKRIKGNETPADLEMENEDVIDCMQQQFGGGSK